MRQPKQARKQKEKEISDDETPKKKPVSSREPIILEHYGVTPEGYPYATVEESDIEKFHSKEQIIDMLTNPQQICNM